MAGDERPLHKPLVIRSLPDSWRWSRLDDLCDGTFDCPHSTPQLTNAGPFVVRSQDIRTGMFCTNQAARVSEETYQERIARAEPKYGDLLYSREGTHFGIAAEVPADVKVCLGQRMFLIRPRPEAINHRFLKFWLNSPAMTAHIGGYRDGSVAERLNLPTIRSLPIVVPPLREQQQIASILGALDDKIELNRQTNGTLEAMARALFKSWFVDFDPARECAGGGQPSMQGALAGMFATTIHLVQGRHVPVGWELGTLDNLTQFVLGGDWGQDGPAEGVAKVRCIRGADIPNLQAGGVGSMPVRYIATSSLAKRSLTAGDLVVEISGGSPTQSTGRPVLISQLILDQLDAPLVCSNFCRIVRLRSPHYAHFVYLWFRHLYSSNEFLQFENGTTGIKNFAFTIFSKTYPLHIPPEKVVVAFDRLVSPLFDRRQLYAVETLRLTAIRDALLPKLISGEIRVKAAEKIVEAAL